ncbi:MAG: Maf family nucleotide pyrophosphatase [Nevskiales bacterium]
MPNPPAPLILASGSPYRRELLARLRLNFTSVSPNVDETPRPGEAAADLALRLAGAKAAAVANQHPDAWVIGSDQVLQAGSQLLGKPGSHSAAVAQLRQLSGQTVQFHTAVCLHTPDGKPLSDNVITQTRYRVLSDEEIARYLKLEPAYDCAGACKAEGLGITLCEEITSSDPTALIGLPLIALRRLLNQAGWRLP